MPEVTSVVELFLSGPFLPIPLLLPSFSRAFNPSLQYTLRPKGRNAEKVPLLKCLAEGGWGHASTNLQPGLAKLSREDWQ